MSIQVGDSVTHESIGHKMNVVGLGDVNEKQMAWCEWVDSNGDMRRTLFPEAELIKQP